MKKSNLLVASAVAIMLAPAALNVLPAQTTQAADSIGTIKAGKGQVVDDNGQATTVTLPDGSSWKLGSSKQMNGETYYLVGNNEWVAASSLTSSDDTTSTSTSTTTNDESTSVLGKIGTVNSSAATVYDGTGKSLNTKLPQGSSWKLGKMVRINNIPYDQVATNQYVLAAYFDVAGATTTTDTNTSTSTSTSTTTDANAVKGKTGTLVNTAVVYDATGKSLGSTLAKGSDWKLGTAINIGNTVYYQIATNEYLLATDVKVATATTPAKPTYTTPTPGNGLNATTTAKTEVYNTETNKHVTLPANTYKVSKLVVNKYGSYYGQVSNNDWVWITSVTLNSGLSLPEYAVSEPEFATHISK